MNVDRDEVLDTYAVAGINDDFLNSEEDLIQLRKEINLHTWGITRDYIFDDGRKYQIELKNDVYSDCPEPKLYMDARDTGEIAYEATWNCDKGSEITFSKANDETILETHASREWGSLYYALVQQKKIWYCLTSPVTDKDFVGKIMITEENQIYFTKYTKEAPCAILYLGARDIGDHKTLKAVGFKKQSPFKLVVSNPGPDPDMTVAIMPINV